MKLRACIAVLAALVAPLVTQLNAQTLQANIAGASALWLEAGLAAYTLGGSTTTCAWTTTKGNASYVADSRVPPGFPFALDYGPLWVTWTPGSSGTCAAPSSNSKVWAYISLDAVLGVRCFFAQPQCTLNTKGLGGDVGANMLPGVTDTPLPNSILAAFNGQAVSMAASDLLPADAKFATYSTLSDCGPLSHGTQFTGFGYGPGPMGQAIYSKVNPTEYFNINDFSVYGTDPATGIQVPPYTITPIGAIPVVVAVNTSNLAGFGAPSFTNVNRGELGLIFTTLLLTTADPVKQPFAGTSATYYGVSALIPEPLSGAYNVFEHTISNNKELYRSQDIANCDPYGNAATNPLISTRTISNVTSYRYRVIGTSEMISELQSRQDSIGYAYWSAENFAGVTNLKYLTVDGIDPLQDTYTGGTLPQGSALANITMSHVADGTYPIWNEQRLISYAAGASAAATLESYLQAQVSFGPGAAHPDFIPDQQLNVFHAHFAPVGVNFNATNTASDGPKVCGPGSNPEDGGDAGGMIFSVQAGADFCVMKGNYGAPGGVGPTNTAAFGVRE